MDLGAGYGRDTLWLVHELKCTVVSVEPTENGSQQITKRAADAGVGDMVTVLCGTTLEWPDKVDGAFDAILMDSVSAFCLARGGSPLAGGITRRPAGAGQLELTSAQGRRPRNRTWLLARGP